jgi:predicted MFS family arabinose efflux permease
MALTWAGTRYPWNSAVIICLFCIFGILLAVFAVEQWLKQDSAILPPRLLKRRSILAGALFSFCCNGALSVFEYYLPTYLQAVRGYSPAKSGYLLIPFIIGLLIAFQIQGSMVNVIGYFVPAMLLGSTLFPIAAGLMTTMSAKDDLAKFLGCSAFLGFAGGIGFQAPQVAVQNTLSEADSHSK